MSLRSKSQERFAVLKGRFLASYARLGEKLPFDDLLYPGGAVPPVEIPEPFTAVKARLESEGDKIDAESLAQAVDDIEAFAQKRLDGHLAAYREHTLATTARQLAESQALQNRLAELEKATAQRAQPPSPVVTAGGAAAAEAPQVIVAGGSGGDAGASAPSCASVNTGAAAHEPRIGVEGALIFEFFGDNTKKDESKLLALSNDVPPELTAALRLLVAAKTDHAKDEILRSIYTILNLGMSCPVEVLGSQPLLKIISTLGSFDGAGGNRKAAGDSDEAASVELHIAELTATRNLAEANLIQREIRASLAKGQAAGLSSHFELATTQRVYKVNNSTALLLKCRARAQMILCKGLISVLESVTSNDTFPSLTGEFSAILALAKEAESKKQFWPELYSTITPTTTLLTLIEPNVNVGTNLIAMVLHTIRTRFRVLDAQLGGNVLRQLAMSDNESPEAFVLRGQTLRDELGPPSPDIDYAKFGLIVNPASASKGAHFKILSDDTLSNLCLIQLEKRIALHPSLSSARAVLTEDVFSRAKNCEVGMDEFRTLFSTLSTQTISCTLTGPVEPDPQHAFLLHHSGRGGGGGGGGGNKSNRSRKETRWGDSNTSAGNSGGGGDSNGSAAQSGAPPGAPPRGRAETKTTPAAREPSLQPGDTTSVQCYERFQQLLGDKYENLVYCVALINAYFKTTVQHEAFVTVSGKVKTPLELHTGFKWRAQSTADHNWNVRRDIYAAWVLLRDRCSGKATSLSSIGTQYKAAHSDWKVLTSDEFQALYAPAATKPRINLRHFTIRKVKVVEFTA